MARKKSKAKKTGGTKKAARKTTTRRAPKTAPRAGGKKAARAGKSKGGPGSEVEGRWAEYWSCGRISGPNHLCSLGGLG
jgi:hypothetical protein